MSTILIILCCIISVAGIVCKRIASVGEWISRQRIHHPVLLSAVYITRRRQLHQRQPKRNSALTTDDAVSGFRTDRFIPTPRIHKENLLRWLVRQIRLLATSDRGRRGILFYTYITRVVHAPQPAYILSYIYSLVFGRDFLDGGAEFQRSKSITKVKESFRVHGIYICTMYIYIYTHCIPFSRRPRAIRRSRVYILYADVVFFGNPCMLTTLSSFIIRIYIYFIHTLCDTMSINLTAFIVTGGRRSCEI